MSRPFPLGLHSSSVRSDAPPQLPAVFKYPLADTPQACIISPNSSRKDTAR